MTLSPLSAEELATIRTRTAEALAGPWVIRDKIQAAVVSNEALVATSALLHVDIPRLLETVAYWQEEAEKTRTLLESWVKWAGESDVPRGGTYPAPPPLPTRDALLADTRSYLGALSERAQGET